MEIDYVDKHCNHCGKSGHTADSCRQTSRNNNTTQSTNANPDPPVCTHCHRTGHLERSCWAKYGRPPNASSNIALNGGIATNGSNGTSRNNAPVPQTVGAGTNSQNTFVRLRRTCFRCGKDDHLIKDCPQQPQQQMVPASYVNSTRAPSALYAIPQVLSNNRVQFDDREIILDDEGAPIPLPLHLALSESYSSVRSSRLINRRCHPIIGLPVVSGHYLQPFSANNCLQSGIPVQWSLLYLRVTSYRLGLTGLNLQI